MKARDLLLRKVGLGLEADESQVDEAKKADDTSPEEKEKSSDDTKEPAEDQGKKTDDEQAQTDEEKEPTDVGEASSGDVDAGSAPVSSAGDSSDASAEEPAQGDDVSSDKNQTGETTVPVEGEVQSSLGDEEKSLLKLNGFDVKEEDLEEAVEEVSTAHAALESIYLQIQGSLESGGLTKDAFVLATNFANTVSKSVGLESINIGLESAETRYQLSVVALESIGEKIKEAGKAIFAFLRKLYDMVIAFIAKTKDTFAKNVQRLALLIEKLTPEKFSATTPMQTNYFLIGGKVSTRLSDDIATSIDNIDSFVRTKLVESAFDHIEDIIGKMSKDESITLEKITQEIYTANTKAFEAADKILKFYSSTHLPTRHLAGRHSTGMTQRSEYQSPSHQIELVETANYSEPVEMSLKKLGLNSESAKALNDLIPKMDQILKYYEFQTMRAQAAVTAATKTAEIYSSADMQQYSKAHIEYQRSMSKFIRLESDMVRSVSDVVREVTRAVAELKG